MAKECYAPDARSQERAFSRAVVTDGGKIVWLGGQTGSRLGPETTGKSVQPSRFDPPDGILQKIFCDDRILSIQIGQYSEEPSVGDVTSHSGRSMWIGKHFEGIS